MSSGTAARIARVSAVPVGAEIREALSEEEFRALLEAATWYAKYHERMIAGQLDDSSAVAEVRRSQFRNLHAGLRKLGVRLRLPDGLTP
jgi:hypothetical protein